MKNRQKKDGKAKIRMGKGRKDKGQQVEDEIDIRS
jgi:hypothetical protein